MAHGKRGRWMRVAVAGLGVLLCTGLVGCTDSNMTKPKDTNKPPQGLPGIMPASGPGAVGGNQTQGAMRTPTTPGIPSGFAAGTQNGRMNSIGSNNAGGVVPASLQNNTGSGAFAQTATTTGPVQPTLQNSAAPLSPTYSSGAGAISPGETIQPPLPPPQFTPSAGASTPFGPQP